MISVLLNSFFADSNFGFKSGSSFSLELNSKIIFSICFISTSNCSESSFLFFNLSFRWSMDGGWIKIEIELLIH